jgi:hypothetical protein
MRSITMQSRRFGEQPDRALERKEAAAARKAAKRVRMDRGEAETWSDARKAAEALFEQPEQD